MKSDAVKRLRTLEDESRRLKRVAAGQALDIQVLKDVLGKGSLRWSSGRPSSRKSRSTPTATGTPVTGWASTGVRCDISRADGTTRPCGSDCASGRSSIRAGALRSSRGSCGPLPVASEPYDWWTMDFVRDTLATGPAFRSLTMLDTGTREALAVEVDTSLPGDRVVAALDAIAVERGYPKHLHVDNGSEFQSQALNLWAHRRQVQLHFIRPGKPVENAFIESFNGGFGTSA